MSDQSVNLSTNGPPETILEPEPRGTLDALAAALGSADTDTRRTAVGAVLESDPRFLDGWARLGQLGRDPIERYAAFRVGYHRGLDRLRQNGWRGSGYVRWDHESNRGFLRARRAPCRRRRSMNPMRRSAADCSSISWIPTGHRAASTDRLVVCGDA